MKNRQVLLRDLGFQDFKTTWDLQEQLLAETLKVKSANRDREVPESTPNHFLWVEHPQLTFRYTTDKQGKPLPDPAQKPETVDAVFLVAWGNLDTIMHYPYREGFDFPSEFDTEIGFKSNEEAK